MASLLVAFLLPAAAVATVSIPDPSNVLDPLWWAADNALLADYNVPAIEVQPTALNASHVFDGVSTSISHVTWSATTNDSDVILIANDAEVNASYVEAVKSGYSTNLIWASFWGFNAAINVANASVANLDHVNVTTHNGAANIYAHGSGTVVNVDDAWLYSSGPVSHGLYASGNATIVARHVSHYSGAYRSSSFSGDTPAGYVYVRDSVAHAAGVGSATYYALGVIDADNVASVSEQGPVIFSDGAQNVTLAHCDAAAGLLSGAVMFSSATRQSGARLELTSTHFNMTRAGMPALWFGNLIVDVALRDFVVTQTPSTAGDNVLVVANFSQVTQDFDRFVGYDQNSNLQPAEATITVAASTLAGDLVPYNGSVIRWSLTEHSAWTGKAYAGYGRATVDVALDASSAWTLTGDTIVHALTDADTSLANIDSRGHTLYYNASANAWLANQTVGLSGGGQAVPILSP